MRLKISSPTTNSDNTYDSRDRLLSEQITDAVNGNRTTSYTYDAVGNRLTMADSVAGATSYTYKAKIAQRAKKVKVHFKPLLGVLFSQG